MHGAQDPAWNMAVDEAILRRYSGDAAPREPTLRLYAWEPPAVSLGRTQPARGSHDPAFLSRERIGLVRRPTGGRAVLHEHERTYAVVGRLGNPPFATGVLDTYLRISGALACGLREMGVDAKAQAASPGPLPRPGGPPACFDWPAAHEIVVRGRKVAGSAQLRRRGAFLQHGSILLRAEPARLAASLGVPVDPRRFTDLEREMGAPVSLARLDDALLHGFRTAFGIALRTDDLTSGEEDLARGLAETKYRSEAWTY